MTALRSAAGKSNLDNGPRKPAGPARRYMTVNRLAIGTFVVGLAVGLGVSALGATGEGDDGSSSELVRNPNRSQESLMALLERKERALEGRERTVEKAEAELRAAEEEVEARLAELKALRAELRVLLEGLDAQREAQVNDLVKTFENMRGKEAAAILSVTDDTVALEVLRRMSRGATAGVLAKMEPERAAFFTEKLGAAALSRVSLPSTEGSSPPPSTEGSSPPPDGATTTEE